MHHPSSSRGRRSEGLGFRVLVFLKGFLSWPLHGLLNRPVNRVQLRLKAGLHCFGVFRVPMAFALQVLVRLARRAEETSGFRGSDSRAQGCDSGIRSRRSGLYESKHVF